MGRDEKQPSGGTVDVRRHLREDELAERWRRSPRTLQRWRQQGRGPAYLSINDRILYRRCDVEAFEARHLRPRADE